jgi:hypothetical protein
MMNRTSAARIVILLSVLTAAGLSAAPAKRRPLGSVRPRQASEVASSNWGVNYFGYAPEFPQEQLLDRAAALGVKWIRLSPSWGEVERKKGEYDWQAADALLAGAVKRGLTPFVLISGGNRLYGGLPPTHNDEAFAAWSRFVEAMVARYKDRVGYWEIWNEPNLPGFWRPEPQPAEYARLLKQAARIIRRLDPRARIIGGVLSKVDLEFTEAFLKEGAGDSLDILCYHPYNSVPEDDVERILALREVARRYNPKVVLWQGECGIPSTGDSIDFRGDSPWGLNIQAKFLLRRFLTDLLCDVPMSAYFMLTEVTRENTTRKPKIIWPEALRAILGDPPDGKANGVNTKGLIARDGWKPKPAYFACQNIASLIDGRYRPADMPVTYKVLDPGVFSGLGNGDNRYPMAPVFARLTSAGGKPLIAYWLPWRPQEVIRPAPIDLRVTGAEWRQPVLVDLLDGKVYALEIRKGTSDFSALPLGDYPMVICERSEVSLR